MPATRVKRPTADDLEMFPYNTPDMPQLLDLDYAVAVAESLRGKDDSKVRDWHEIMGWIFNLMTAYHVLAPKMQNGAAIRAKLAAAQFCAAPSLKAFADIEDNEDYEVEVEVYYILRGLL